MKKNKDNNKFSIDELLLDETQEEVEKRTNKEKKELNILTGVKIKSLNTPLFAKTEYADAI